MQIQAPVQHVVMVGRKLRIGSGSYSISNNNDNGGETNELWMSWAKSRTRQAKPQLSSSLMKASQKLREQPDCVVTADKSNSNSVFPFDVNAAVREMEPIDFSLPSNFLDPCNVQPILQAKAARLVKNNCSVCSHCSFGQKQQQRANTSGGRLAYDDQTQAEEGGTLVT